MPCAAIIPRKSSGEVSTRVSKTGPFLASSTAFSALRKIRPLAAPGPAGKPLQSKVAFFRATASNTGERTWSSCSAGTRLIAVFQSIKRSFTISAAMRTAAIPVRFPLRVCSMYSTSSSMVNSKSCMSLKCFSNFFWTSTKPLKALGSTRLS